MSKKNNAELRNTSPVTTSYAFTIDLNGWSFNLIYGDRSDNGFIAIPNWGICVEASSADDTFYNTERLSNCSNEIVAANAKTIANVIKELYK